jgi:hypothetical protein
MDSARFAFCPRLLARRPTLRCSGLRRCGSELGEAALLARRGVAMDQALPRRAIEERHGGEAIVGACRRSAGTLDGRAQRRALGPIANRSRARLTQVFLRGLDIRHGKSPALRALNTERANPATLCSRWPCSVTAEKGSRAGVRGQESALHGTVFQRCLPFLTPLRTGTTFRHHLLAITSSIAAAAGR